MAITKEKDPVQKFVDRWVRTKTKDFGNNRRKPEVEVEIDESQLPKVPVGSGHPGSGPSSEASRKACHAPGR